jgi:spermidine synthase
MSHVPLFAHGRAKRALIVGGGDGGVLREALKHPELEEVTLCEIDRGVIDLCRQYFPEISAGAYDHPRARIVIADGTKFVAETGDRFDVIMVDSTDPVGPGAVLFTREFYAGCQRCLKPGGLLVTQNGLPFLQAGELTQSISSLPTRLPISPALPPISADPCPMAGRPTTRRCASTSARRSRAAMRRRAPSRPATGAPRSTSRPSPSRLTCKS